MTDERSVYLVQCLCPARHAIFAYALTLSETEAAKTRCELADYAAMLTKWVPVLQEMGINPWCALCHASAQHWCFEINKTQFATIEDAMPRLKEIEADNLATQVYLLQQQRRAQAN